jgi:hypothetical protein
MVALDIVKGLEKMNIYDDLENIVFEEEDELGAWSCNQDNDESKVLFSLKDKKTKQKFNVTIEEDRI